MTILIRSVRLFSESIWAKQEEATSDCSCLCPRPLMSFLYQRAGPYCPVRRVGLASPL